MCTDLRCAAPGADASERVSASQAQAPPHAPPPTLPEDLTRMVLQRTSSWNDLPYVAYPPGQVQLTVVEYNIPANTSLPWHTHAAPNTAFIISGAITIEERATGRVATYRAGEAFAESVDNVHRGFTGPEPARIVVAYAGAVGVPLSTPVPD